MALKPNIYYTFSLIKQYLHNCEGNFSGIGTYMHVLSCPNMSEWVVCGFSNRKEFFIEKGVHLVLFPRNMTTSL